MYIKEENIISECKLYIQSGEKAFQSYFCYTLKGSGFFHEHNLWTV